MTNRIALNGGQDWLDYRNGSGNTVEILDIHVGSERRKGIGRRMVNVLFSRLQATPNVLVWAITRHSNVIAQHFYEELRFRVVAVLRDFYDEKETGTRVDAIMYGRRVSSVA